MVMSKPTLNQLFSKQDCKYYTYYNLHCMESNRGGKALASSLQESIGKRDSACFCLANDKFTIHYCIVLHRRRLYDLIEHSR